MRGIIWLQLALATPVVLWGGWPFFERFWASLKSRNLNMFTLIGLGVGVAYTYSLVATVAPGAFPPSLHTMGGLVPVYFEAAAAITTLVLLGQVLELRARYATGRAIRALLGLAPKTARKVGATARKRMFRLSMSRSATSCGCAPAKKCRSTASSSTAIARSMKR